MAGSNNNNPYNTSNGAQTGFDPSKNAPEGYKWVPGVAGVPSREGHYEKVPFQGQESVPHPNVSRSDDNYASKTRANLARSQFEDYKKRFKPFEEELVEMGKQNLSDTGLMGEATETAAGQFDIAQETAQRNRARYGLGGGQSESAQRNSALDRAASIVGAQNRTRDQYQSQQLGLLGGMGGN